MRLQVQKITKYFKCKFCMFQNVLTTHAHQPDGQPRFKAVICLFFKVQILNPNFEK